VVEVPRGGLVKRQLDGPVSFVSPLPCPFNYGCVPGEISPDGDPLDALILGPRLPRLHRQRWRVWAVVDFVDAGLPDPKLVCAYTRPTPAQRAGIMSFFTAYGLAKSALRAVRLRPKLSFVRGWEQP